MLAMTEHDPYRMRPWTRPGWKPACPWPRQTPIDYKTDRTWYSVACTPGSERAAADWLERFGFRPYWAHYTTHPRGKDGKQRPVPRSVIPGLLFVPMAAGDEAFDALRHCGETARRRFRLLIVDGQHQALTEWQIGRIREIAAELDTPPAERRKLPDWCKVGVRVRVKVVGDEHWDLSGPILSIASCAQIRVDAYMLGSRRPITVPITQVERI